MIQILITKANPNIGDKVYICMYSTVTINLLCVCSKHFLHKVKEIFIIVMAKIHIKHIKYHLQAD